MSKLNPQKATAYVGPGVLKKGGKITPVPNGPLIKKKGKFKGSTLKNGGPVQKERRIIAADKTAVKKVDANKIMKNDNEITARNFKNTAAYHKNQANKSYQAARSFLVDDNNETMYKFASKSAKEDDSLFNVAAKKAKEAKANPRFKNVNSFPKLNVKKKAKSGAMIKRADGSMSRRGLWDNIRANKGSGKKPTAAMLKQEKKIKAKTKK